MKLITHAKSEVPLDTMKQVTYFTGEILEELLQDCINNSKGMSYEMIGKLLIQQIVLVRNERTNSKIC